MKSVVFTVGLLWSCLFIQQTSAQIGNTLTKPVPEKEFQQVKSTLSKLDPKSYLIKMKVIGADGAIRDEVLGMKSLAGLKKDQLTGGFLVNNGASQTFPGLGGNQTTGGGQPGKGFGLNSGSGKQGLPGQPGSTGGRQENGLAFPKPGTGNQQQGGGTGGLGGFNIRIDQMGNGGSGSISRPGGMVMGKDGGAGGGKPEAGGGKPDAGGGTKTEGPKTGPNNGSGGTGSSGGDRTPPNTSGGSGSSGGDRTPPNSGGTSGSGGADRTPPNRSGHNNGGFGRPVGNNVIPKGGGRGGNTQTGMPDPEGNSATGQPDMLAGNSTLRDNPAAGNTGQRNPGVRNPGSQVVLPADFRQGSFFVCEGCTEKALGMAGMQRLEQFMATYR